MIRLALLDDDACSLRRALAGARDIELLAAAADEVALARALAGRQPDILVLDYDPARGDALARCRRIRSRPGAPRVLIQAAQPDPALAIAARAAQADGLVGKHEPPHALVTAIRAIAAGETAIPKVSRGAFEAAVARLEDADLPVFAMLLDGEPLPAIADGLRTDEGEAARRTLEVVGRLRPTRAG